MNTYWIIEWRDGTRSAWPLNFISAEQVQGLRQAARAFLLSTVA